MNALFYLDSLIAGQTYSQDPVQKSELDLLRTLVATELKNLSTANIAYSQEVNTLIGRASRSDEILKGGHFVGGPNASAIVYNTKYIEPVIKALCLLTGDDEDDYTATSLDNPQVGP